MSKKQFGTDGVRGRVGAEPMTVDFAIRLASAAAQVLVPEGGTVVIGKDTRLSGYMFESALEAGFVGAGADVLLLGPLPTPGIAVLTQEFEADLGVVISASHNPYEDNGIKFFDRSGSKLSDAIERQIESQMQAPPITRDSAHLGKAKLIHTARVSYQEFCESTFPDGLGLDGLKVVFDGANGAGYKVGPRTLANLGAEVIPIGCSPNGRNINHGCGSTSPELLSLTVPAVKADVGVALDGDGDRVLFVDDRGETIDGDQLLYVIALHRLRTGRSDAGVVGTQMSNLGLELALRQEGLQFVRARVGDRHVPVIIGGDFNTSTRNDITALRKHYRREADLLPVRLPPRCTVRWHVWRTLGVGCTLDHLFVRGLATGSAGIAEQALASDHFPIWARVGWPP